MKFLCFIYFLFFYLIFISCECDFSQLLPGIIRASKGVDITELNFFPDSIDDMIQESGFKKSLIALTCNHPRHWKNSFLNASYLVPDQIAGINLEPNGQFTEMVNTHRSVDTISQMIELGGGLSFDTQGYGEYSFGGGYGNMESSLADINKTIVEMSAMALAYSFDFKPYVVTKKVDEFYEMIKNLKDKSYAKNPTPYDKLFETFGTHYFTSAKLGGYVRFRTMISSEYYDSTSKEEIFAYVGADYKHLISVEVDVNTEVEKNEKTYEEHYKRVVHYYGGTSKIINEAMNMSQFNNWLLGVEESPYLFDGTLEPITNLIDDQAVLKEIEIAMLAKMTKKYLQSMMKIVKSVLHYDNEVENAIERCLKEVVPQPPNCNISEIQSQMTILFNEYHPKLTKSELLGSSLCEFNLHKSLKLQMHDLFMKRMKLAYKQRSSQTRKQIQTSSSDEVK